MAVELGTALAGLAAAQERRRASANGLANASTRVARTEPADGVSLNQGAASDLELVRQDTNLARDLVAQRAAAYQFVANLRVLQTQLRLSGVMVDIYA